MVLQKAKNIRKEFEQNYIYVDSLGTIINKF